MGYLGVPLSSLQDQLVDLPESKQWIATRIEVVKSSPDGARGWLRNLGKNDLDHAKAVEDYAGKILEESGVRLEPEEIYLLLHAIYTHDVGYRTGAKDHAKRSHDAIVTAPESFFIHDAKLAQGIAYVVLSHAKDSNLRIPDEFPIDFLSRTKQFDLRFLGAVLSLADELDQVYLRVFNCAGQEDSPRNLVCHVEIGPQLIKLKTEPASMDDWERLNQEAQHIQRRLDDLRPILSKRGIGVEKVILYPTVWTGRSPHRRMRRETDQAHMPRQTQKLLFLLDASVMGAQILQQLYLGSRPITLLPISAAHRELAAQKVEDTYSAVVWMLGEDFYTPVSNAITRAVVRNTSEGGGLVLFPFVAWSVSQGINDLLQDVLPVALTGQWSEGEKQRIGPIDNHPIANGIKPFRIQNTYEHLGLRGNGRAIMADVVGNPFLAVQHYGKGRVAYINASSHLCWRTHGMISPWQQEPLVQKIIERTLSWVCNEVFMP